MILQYLKWYIFHENTESLFCNPKHIEYCLSNEKERVDGWLQTHEIIKNKNKNGKNLGIETPIKKLILMGLLKRSIGSSTRKQQHGGSSENEAWKRLGRQQSRAWAHREKKHFREQGHPCHSCWTNFQMKDTAATQVDKDTEMNKENGSYTHNGIGISQQEE